MKHLHFVGIGGIGMSGLAAMCVEAGYKVTGSDRGADRPENRRILDALERQGIVIYPQDGSYIRNGTPDELIYSTAIEDDNPDFAAGKEICRTHRSALVERIIRERGAENSIAICGSCGKSTVTAYCAETLANLGEVPECLNGALMKRFINEKFAGNYAPGEKKYLVFEADESDKSLLNYSPEYAIILNIGTDHYSKEELAEVFGKFLQKVRKGAVLSGDVYEAVRTALPPELEIKVFGSSRQSDCDCCVSSYSAGKAEFNGSETITLPQSGFHMALNALAIKSLLEMLGYATSDILKALEKFSGVWRRNDFAGRTSCGAPVYDDYAHNPEKILACIKGMRETVSGNVYAVFQPHGFKPFGFMKDELFNLLEGELRPNDRFILLPPYYAGGTASFHPTAEEVLTEYQNRSSAPARFMTFPDRDLLRAFLLQNADSDDIIVIMGARDNSLSDYAASLCI
ncbi:MAG: hypothetical protein J6C40_07945 [Lentisphaeria bacterium]|nr:hypothetical protein [Lentisphaeria bacterium]